MSKKVGLEIKLPDSPKRSLQEEWLRIVKILAISVLILAIIVAFLAGGPMLLDIALQVIR
jgi:hypothetical protein